MLGRRHGAFWEIAFSDSPPDSEWSSVTVQIKRRFVRENCPLPVLRTLLEIFLCKENSSTPLESVHKRLSCWPPWTESCPLQTSSDCSLTYWSSEVTERCLDLLGRLETICFTFTNYHSIQSFCRESWATSPLLRWWAMARWICCPTLFNVGHSWFGHTQSVRDFTNGVAFL